MRNVFTSGLYQHNPCACVLIIHTDVLSNGILTLVRIVFNSMTPSLSAGSPYGATISHLVSSFPPLSNSSAVAARIIFKYTDPLWILRVCTSSDINVWVCSGAVNVIVMQLLTNLKTVRQCISIVHKMDVLGLEAQSMNCQKKQKKEVMWCFC